MLRYFRINDPYRLLGLLVISILIYLPVFIDTPAITIVELKSILIGNKIREGNVPYAQLVTSTAPLTSWFYAVIHFLFGSSLLARHILAFLIIFLQSAFIGIIFIDKKVFSENSYLPSFIYSILFCFSVDTTALSGELIGAFFLLFALHNLFKEIEFRTQRDETVLNLGIFISIASLFSFAYSVYLLAASIILLIFSRRNLRSFLLMMVGFILPHAFLISFYYLWDSAGELWSFYYVPNLSFRAVHYMSGLEFLVLGALPLLYFLVSLLVLNRESRFTKYQAQLVQTMFIWTIFSFIAIFYAKGLRPQNLIILIPGFTFFFTHLILFIRRRRLAEISLWVLFIGVFGLSILTRYNYIGAVSYDNMKVKENKQFIDKKILVLQNDISFYRHNHLATSFLDWELSKTVFEEPDFYENTILVNKAITIDPPDIIIDPDNYMQGFMKRIPVLEKEYALRGGRYYRQNTPSN